MKKGIKITLIVILVAVIALITLGFAYLKGVPVTHKGLKYAEKYRNMESVDYVGFTEQDFGEYEEIQFQVRDVKGAFRSVGAMYTATYSQEQYEEQLAVVDSWDYLEEAENTDENGNACMPAVEVTENGWTIRVLEATGDESYPKCFEMVGTNDDSQTIAYLHFTDPDLDYISEESGAQALEDFVEEYFGFQFD